MSKNLGRELHLGKRIRLVIIISKPNRYYSAQRRANHAHERVNTILARSRMMRGHDLLYSVFERHLLIVTNHHEDIPTFVATIVEEYIFSLSQQGIIVPKKMRRMLEEDLREEVLEMTRKKIYGYSSIQEYRTQNIEIIHSYLRKNC
ncbi:MAG: hypothetical protein KDD25_08060 [Bdellovibrionales bacterium]|nr:hypothetical protein [Bdellovibrionales bacterium]